MFRPKPFHYLVTLQAMSGSEGQQFDQIAGSMQAKALRAEGILSMENLKPAQQADAQAIVRMDQRPPLWFDCAYLLIAQKRFYPA